MRLIIFDIDGTLTDTMNLDDMLYRDALKNALNIKVSDKDFEHFKKITTGTDSGITDTILKKELGREDITKEYNILKEYFLKTLEYTYFNNPELFKEIPGAKNFFDSLFANERIKVGIATGSWKESGLIKLKSIGIDSKSCIYGHSDLYRFRSEIVYHVIQETQKKYAIQNFSKITYIGDGVWDYMTSKELNIDFIGIDPKDNGMLKNLGAKVVIRDYIEKEMFKLIDL